MPKLKAETLLVLLAVALRIALVLVLESYTVPRSTYEHGTIAANLVQGKGFSTKFLGTEGATSQQAPAYPLMVALCYRFFGVESPSSLLVLQFTQAVLGGLLVVATMALTRELAPGRPLIANAAGCLVAFHPTLVYSATHVQVAGLAALLLTAASGAIGPSVENRESSGRRRCWMFARSWDPDGSHSGARLRGLCLVLLESQSNAPWFHAAVDRRGDLRSRSRPLDDQERARPPRVRRYQNDIWLCLLAGQLLPERGHR